MNSEKFAVCTKAYDAIEDAINQSKKAVTRTWDDLNGSPKRSVDKGEEEKFAGKRKVTSKGQSNKNA